MNLLKTLFKRKKSYSETEKFKLCIVDENSKYMPEVLGISDQRSKQLVLLASKAYEQSDLKTESIQIILDECVHINEVVVSLQCFDKICEYKQREKDISNSLSKLFGNE